MTAPIECCRYFAICLIWITFLSSTTVAITAATLDGCDVRLNMYLIPVPLYFFILEEPNLKKKIKQLSNHVPKSQNLLFCCAVISLLPIAPLLAQSWLECKSILVGVWVLIIDCIIGVVYMFYGLLKTISFFFKFFRNIVQNNKQKEIRRVLIQECYLMLKTPSRYNEIRKNFYELFIQYIHFKSGRMSPEEAYLCSVLLTVSMKRVKKSSVERKVCGICDEILGQSSKAWISPCCKKLNHISCMGKKLMGKLECDTCGEDLDQALYVSLKSDKDLKATIHSLYD